MSAELDWDCESEPGGPYYEGWCAYQTAKNSGVGVSNPHDSGTVDAIDWQGGWNEAEGTLDD